MEYKLMSYKEFMDFMNYVMKHNDKKYNCLDQQLLSIITQDKELKEEIKKLKQGTFISYKKTNGASIGSLAKKISNKTSVKALAKHLKNLDENPNSYGFLDGELEVALAPKFPTYIPPDGPEYDDCYLACAATLKQILVYEAASYKRKPKSPIALEENQTSEDTTSLPTSNPFSEYILDRISRNKKYYVETHIYTQVLDLLKKKRRLLLIGNPGIGKTTTTEMVAQSFYKNGYALVFSEDIEKTEDILSLIMQNKDSKELIILDDCFGQIYYKLTESRQRNYLCRLIRKIADCPNKFLLLNSRVNIYNSAKNEETPLSEALQELSTEKLVFEPDSLSRLEKAKILIKHLSLSTGFNKYYCRELIKDQNYDRIINHKNYTPRIMQHIASSLFLDGIKPESIMKSILSTLDNPLKIWDDEYKRKLTQRDRLVLTTLYSITDGLCERNACEKAYNKRIALEPSIDKSINNWKEALSLMNGSMIETVISQDVYYIKVLNPSVNDYLRENIMTPDSSETMEMRKAILYYCQIDRLYPDPKERSDQKEKIIKDKSVLTLLPLYPVNSTRDIVYEIVYTGTCFTEYKPIIKAFMANGVTKKPWHYSSKPYNFSEPLIGRSSTPEMILALLVSTPTIYEYYFSGEFTALSVFDFLKKSDSFSSAWESLAMISMKKQGFFNLDNEEIRNAFIDALESLIVNHTSYYDLSDQIAAILETERSCRFIPFTSRCKSAIEKELIKDRINEIKDHTIESYQSDEKLEQLANSCIDSYEYDFSYDIDEYLSNIEKALEESDEDQPDVQYPKYEQHLNDEKQIRESFYDLYREKCSVEKEISVPTP